MKEERQPLTVASQHKIELGSRQVRSHPAIYCLHPSTGRQNVYAVWCRPLRFGAAYFQYAYSQGGVPVGNINYRAVHTKSMWRKVSSHQSIESAIHGKDGAAGLFARKVRINYETHGDPCYVVVWEQGAQNGFVIKPDPTSPTGIRQVSIPISDILAFESKGQASQSELGKYF